MKRVLSILVSIAMILGLVLVPASATSTVPTVTVQSLSEEAKPGDTVTLEVTIANNPGFTNFEWNIVYDDSKLELKSINTTEAISVPGYGTFNVPYISKENVTYIVEALVDTNRIICGGSDPFSENKTLFTLTFNVNAEAAAGDAEVKITSDKFENVATEEAIFATYVAGGVKVADIHTYGDLIPAKAEVHTQTKLEAAVAAHYFCDHCDTYFTAEKKATTLEALTSEKPAHAYGEWQKSDEKHWKECSCGLKAEEADHAFDNDADATCDTCGYNRVVHTCGDATLMPGQAATCENAGWKDYYKCSCNKLYADEACKSEITNLVAWQNGEGKIAAGHTYGELKAAQAEVHTQTELKAAVAAHYFCDDCDTYFTEGKVATTLEALTGEKPAHSYGEWQKSDEKHWKECSCGLKAEEVDHAFDNDADETCDCGYVREITGGSTTGGSTTGGSTTGGSTTGGSTTGGSTTGGSTTGGSTTGGSTTGGSTTGGSTTGGSTTGDVSIVVKTEGENTFASVEVSDAEAEKIVENLAATNGNLALDLESVGQDTVALPGNLVEALTGSDAENSVSVTTEHSSVTMSADVLNTVANAMAKEDTVVLQIIAKEEEELAAEQQEALESIREPDVEVVVLELKLTVIDAQGNVKKEISDLGGDVEIIIQCAPEMQGKDVVACYISSEGVVTYLDSQYDADANTLTFKTVHFSVYAAVVRGEGSTGGSTTGGSTTGGSTTGGSTTGGSTTGGSTTGGSTTGGSTTGGSTTTVAGTTYTHAYDAQRSPAFPSTIGSEIVAKSFAKPLKADSSSRYDSNEGPWTLREVGTYGDKASFSPAPNSYLDGVVTSVANMYGLNTTGKNGLVIHELLDKNSAHVAFGVIIAADETNGYALFVGDLWSNSGAGYLLSNTAITAGTVTFNADQIAQSTYSISLAPATVTFATAEEGYTAPAAQMLTITNTGDTATGALTATLSGGANSKFTLSKSSFASLAEKNDTTTFTVVPKTGLAAGTYTENITVKGDNVVPVNVTVSFTVTSGPYGAQIDDVKYETLAAAVAAVQEGETIVLLKDITETGIAVSKTIFFFINSNGYGYNANTAIVAGPGYTCTKSGSPMDPYLAVFDFEPEVILVEGLSLNKGTTSLTVGGAETLIATVTPANATYQTVTWTSSNPAVATVDQSGRVNAIAAGTATITASIDAGPHGILSVSCEVTVTAAGGGDSGGGNSGGGNSGGGGSSWIEHKIEIAKTANGTVITSETEAYERVKVTITATPDAGYKVAKVIVTEKGSGAKCNVTARSETKYSFYMPGDAVTVTVIFECIGDSSTCVSHYLTDVDQNEWYHIAVDYAVSNGLMKGIGGDLFAPDASMERSMVIQVLYNMEKTPAVTYTGKFTDVPAGQWYTNAIEWGVANKLVSGYGDIFKPNGNITREEIATILYNYAKFKGIDVSARGDLSKFSDGNTTSAWAKEFMQWAVGSGLMSGGGGKLNPTGNATRAEVAQMFKNFNEIFGF